MKPSASNKFLYFAFGSNLLTKRIHFQNPSAVAKGPALLKDYQLQFRLPSKRWGGHAATIMDAPGEHVWGVLWELDVEHLTTLDDQEGVHKKLYKRISVTVEMKDTGEMIEALSYQVLPDQMEIDLALCKPSKVYKKVILDGARENGLPEEYIKRLEAIEDTGIETDVILGLPLHIRDVPKGN